MAQTLRYMENQDLDNVTYYTIHTWIDADTYGTTVDLAFTTLIAAVLEMERVIKTGRYERVAVRKVDVIKRRENCEYSTSELVKEWNYEY